MQQESWHALEQLVSSQKGTACCASQLVLQDTNIVTFIRCNFIKHVHGLACGMGNRMQMVPCLCLSLFNAMHV